MYLPKQWSEITVEQFIEIADIDKEQGAYYYNTEILSILCNESTDVIDNLDVDDLFKIVKQ